MLMLVPSSITKFESGAGVEWLFNHNNAVKVIHITASPANALNFMNSFHGKRLNDA
jgi:hypothetical protein